MTVVLRYEDGTVRIEGLETDGVDDTDTPGEELSGATPVAEVALADLPSVESDPRTGTGRTPAYRYVDLLAALDGAGIEYEDEVLVTDPLPDLSTTYELRDYQHAALDAWEAGEPIEDDANRGAETAGAIDRGAETAGATDDRRARERRGVLELPTGSGKTVIGIAAIAALGTPTLVVAPTIDLVEQWRRELETEFGDAVEVGQLGGGRQDLAPITVATYDSAYLRADDVGDRFGLLIADEAHHLGGEGYRDIARLSAAPARMGLTATFERQDGAHEVVADLLGPLVYALSADDLAGEHLATYDLKRVEVELTDEERAVYERNQETFTDYLARSNLQLRSGSDYQELVKRSGTDPEAREALLAKQRAREVMMGADRKVERLADLLDRHRDDRVIVFTAHNDLAYEVSERFLIPAITHRTPTDERREILARFREGEYARVVTSNVLDEGVDVPDANVAVVLSGSGSEREFVQRLGRVLRPTDDGRRALLYELVTTGTVEEDVVRRRRG